MSIRAVSFDFWNTLFAEQPGGFALYAERRLALVTRAVSNFGDFSDEKIQTAFNAEARHHFRLWSEDHRTPGARARLDAILAHLRVQLPDEDAASLATAFENGVLDLPPVLIDGAKELICDLSNRYPLGIISDTGFSPGRVLRKLLDQNDLLGAFESLVFSDEAGRSKPHPRVFERTTRKLQASPEQMIHVGDLEPTDVRGSKDAGFRAVRFIGVSPMAEGERSKADRVIARLQEMWNVLDEF